MSRPNDSGAGGMTGATGDLTPDDADRPFVPAELREISDPDHRADVTAAQGRHAPGQHGLPAADPANRVEPRAEHASETRRSEPGDTDEHSDHEEHF